jgi:hypothetical protein
VNAYWPPATEQTKLINAALRTIQADHYSREDDPHWDAEREYAAEQLALAAGELVRAVGVLPEGGRPIGWNEPTTEEAAALQAELRRLRAVERAAYVYADDLDDYCSPHGVPARYAKELRARLQGAAQQVGASEGEQR